MLTAGVDVGAKTIKVVVLDGAAVRGRAIAPGGLDTRTALAQVFDEALAGADELMAALRQRDPAVLGAPGGIALAQQIFALAGSASNVALTGVDPGLVAGGYFINPPFGPGPGQRVPLPIDCDPAVGAFCSSANLVSLPASYVPLQ